MPLTIVITFVQRKEVKSPSSQMETLGQTLGNRLSSAQWLENNCTSLSTAFTQSRFIQIINGKNEKLATTAARNHIILHEP